MCVCVCVCVCVCERERERERESVTHFNSTNRKKYFLVSVLVMGTFSLRECPRDDELFEIEKKSLNDKAILP